MTQHLTQLSIEQKVGQLFFVGIPGPEIDRPTRDLIDEVSPGGICLFTRNVKERQQTRGLLDELRSSIANRPFLSVDQEGGLVDRLRRIMTPLPAASKLATVADAAELGYIIGESLYTLGFNMNFAPVVDVIDSSREKFSNGLFSRTFGRTKEDVVRMAAAFLEALQASGISGCLKHFPGLAASRVDSHEDLPLVEVDESELTQIDLFPYIKLLETARIDAIMVAHAAFPVHRLQEVSQNGEFIPSSLSFNIVTKLLRDDLGFEGLVITDDLEMGAIIKNFGIGEACTEAILAGADMLAICADPENIRAGYRFVLESAKCGVIPSDRLDQSIERIARAKAELSEPPRFDLGRLERLSDRINILGERLAT